MRAAPATLLCLLAGLSCDHQPTPGAAAGDPEPARSPAGETTVEEPVAEPEPGPEPEADLAPGGEGPAVGEPAEAPDPIAAAPPAVEGETPSEAVERCRQTEAFDACLIRALDDRDVRARERELLIEANQHLDREERAREHMRIFLEQYPRDRRGNRYRMILYDGDRD